MIKDICSDENLANAFDKLKEVKKEYFNENGRPKSEAHSEFYNLDILNAFWDYLYSNPKLKKQLDEEAQSLKKKELAKELEAKMKELASLQDKVTKLQNEIASVEKYKYPY